MTKFIRPNVLWDNSSKTKGSKRKFLPWKGIKFGKIQFEVAAKMKMHGNNNIFYENKHLNLTFYLDAANSTIWHVNEKLFVLKYNDIF